MTVFMYAGMRRCTISRITAPPAGPADMIEGIKKIAFRNTPPTQKAPATMCTARRSAIGCMSSLLSPGKARGPTPAGAHGKRRAYHPWLFLAAPARSRGASSSPPRSSAELSRPAPGRLTFDGAFVFLLASPDLCRGGLHGVAEQREGGHEVDSCGLVVRAVHRDA